MNNTVLSIAHVSKTFYLHHQHGAALAVLNDVSLEVAPGECVALDGSSGVGKSSLLKLIYANYLAVQGSIRVRNGKRDGDDAFTEMVGAAPREIIGLRRDTIGYVSQFLRVIPRVPALEVVAEPLIDDAQGDPLLEQAARDAAGELLARLAIPRQLWQLPPATFSGGEQQRINVARGLIKFKPLILLDEPTASLDAANTATVVALISEARQRGAGIVGIFHDPKVRDAVATRVVPMGHFTKTP
jgi:alpha-D-ribose 1-methylphosphonate 5-triphosphate synthase subunit PhnL